MSATLYSARWTGPTLIEKDKAQTVSVSVERAGSATTLTSGTLTLYRPNGSKLVDAVAGSVSGGTFTSATISASDTQNEDFGPRWLIEIDLVISGETFTFYNDAVLCLARLYPPIGQTDLIQRHSEAANLLGIYAALADGDIEAACARFAGQSFAAFKGELADLAAETLGRIGAEMRRLEADPGYIEALLKDGAERAEAIARPILSEVYDAVGFLPAGGRQS